LLKDARQVGQASASGERIKECFEQPPLGPELVVDGRAGDVGLAGDVVDDGAVGVTYVVERIPPGERRSFEASVRAGTGRLNR
jgi:hypothetical protein